MGERVRKYIRLTVCVPTTILILTNLQFVFIQLDKNMVQVFIFVD